MISHAFADIYCSHYICSIGSDRIFIGFSYDWLSCKSGVVSWTANTTGVPRQATLNFKNGALCTVTQVAPADLKGSYTFYNYSFKSSGVSDTKVVNQNNRQHETAVQFKAVENPTTVNGHVHNRRDMPQGRHFTTSVL